MAKKISDLSYVLDYSGKMEHVPELPWDNSDSDPITYIRNFVDRQRMRSRFNPRDWEPYALYPDMDSFVNKIDGTVISGAAYLELSRGGEDMQERSTLGSYGYALKCFAEGLSLATDREYITAEEAKAEFRSHVRTVIDAEQQKQYVANLEKQLREAQDALAAREF